MKILVVSDSHLNLSALINIFEAERPDVVFGAGDHSKDLEELSYVKERAEYYIVRGNCDYFDRCTEDVLRFDLNGYKFMLTHGHLYGVKSSYEALKKEAIDNGVDVVVFGHTHIPCLELEDGVHIFNPGAAKDGCYGVIDIGESGIEFYHKNLLQNKN